MRVSQLVLDVNKTLGNIFVLKKVEPYIPYGTDQQDGWKYTVIPFDTDIDQIIVKVSSNNSKPLVKKNGNELVFVAFENLQAKPYVKDVTASKSSSKDEKQYFVNIELSISATNVARLKSTKE